MVETDNRNWPTRRTVLEGGAVTGLLLAARCSPSGPSRRMAVMTARVCCRADPDDADAPVINAEETPVELDPRTTLLDALREHLGLTGSKKGCDHGQCGACTVLVNGRRINACLTLAVMHEGDEITTIEGLADGERAASDAGRLHRAMTASSAATARPARSARPSACWAKPRPAGRAMSPPMSPR